MRESENAQHMQEEDKSNMGAQAVNRTQNDPNRSIDSGDEDVEIIDADLAVRKYHH